MKMKNKEKKDKITNYGRNKRGAVIKRIGLL